MPETPIFGFPLLTENQAGRVDLAHNEAIVGLELTSNLAIASRTLFAPPTTIQNAFYIPKSPATGAWSGKENQLAYYFTDSSTWRFYDPPLGFRAYCIAEALDLRWNGTTWDEIVIAADMNKSVYDTDNDGIVDAAEVAQLADLATVAAGLNGTASAFYLDRANHTGTQNVSSLNISGNSKYVGTDSAGNKGVYDIPQQSSPETGSSIKTKLEALTGTARLEASAIQNLPAGTSETGLTIVSKLEALTGTDRLNASAIEGSTGNITVFNEGVQLASNVNAIDFVGDGVNATFNNGLWTPVDIINSVNFWLEANSGYKDKSNNARLPLNSTNRGTIVPNVLNGNSVIQFTNTQGLSYGNPYDPSLVSIFAVVKYSNSDIRILNISGNSTSLGTRNLFDLPPARYTINNGTTTQNNYTGGTIGANAWHLFEFRGLPLTLFNNGTALSTTPSTGTVLTPDSLANSRITLNAVVYNPITDTFSVFSSATLGEIAEIVVIDKTLPTAVHEQIEGYLAHKYGLAANLPTNHPYKNAAPTSANVKRAIVTVSPILAPVQTANFVALPNRIYPVDSSGGAITATLDVSANWTDGTRSTFFDAAGSAGSSNNGFALNSFTIAANSGQNIVGDSNLILNVDCQSVTLQFAAGGRFNIISSAT